MIFGIGVDTVELDRFARLIVRTPKLVPRLFVPSEQGLPTRSLAARFAAKEALIKALGGSGGLSWHDLEIVRGADRAPRFARTPGLERELVARGANRVHVSMTHDGGMATAFVVIERIDVGGDSHEDAATSDTRSTLETHTPTEEAE